MKRLPRFSLAVSLLIMLVMIPVLATALTSPVNNSPPACITSVISNSNETVQTAVSGATCPNLAIDNVTVTFDNVKHMAQGAMNAVNFGALATFVNSMATNGATTNGATFSGANTQTNTQAQARIQVRVDGTSAMFTAKLTANETTSTTAGNISDSIKGSVNYSKVSDVISATVGTNSLQVTALSHTFYYMVNFSSDGTCVSSGECVAIVTAEPKIPNNSVAADNNFMVTYLTTAKDQEGRAYAKELVGVASEGNITLVDAIADTATGRAPSTYNAGTFAYDTTAAGLVALNFA